MANGVVHFFDTSRFLSSVGGVAGATVYFYYTGTTNPAPVYSDKNLTIPATNPVTVAVGAIVPSLYLDPTVSYRRRIVFTDTSVHDVDPIASAGYILATDLSASSGSSLVSFKNPLSGTVSRTVQDKLSEAISVKDFGAVGDGSADDSTAFSNAIASGREVHIPAGIYKITPRTFSNFVSCKIRGAGRDVTKIILSSSGVGLTFTNCHWLQISDLTITASGAAQSLASSSGIELNTGSSNCTFERMNFCGFSLDGIRLVGTLANNLSGNTVRDCYFLGSGRNQVYEYYNNDATWDNIQIGMFQGVTHALFGWYRELCGESGINLVKIWQNQVGLKELNCTGTRHGLCRIELSDHENVWVEGGYGNVFDACRMYSASQTGNGLYDNFYAKNTLRLTLTDSQVITWDATYSKWAVNFDTGCDDLNISANTFDGFDATNFGPIRFDGSVTQVTGDMVVFFNTTTLAANTTAYMSNGAVITENAALKPMNRQYAVGKIYFATDVAPGAAQSFTYTLRKNSVDTAMACSATGAGVFSSITTATAPQIIYNMGDSLSVKLVTSLTAAVASHRGFAVLIAY